MVCTNVCKSEGHSEVVKILLENGAQVDLQKENGWYALMCASPKGHAEVVKILLENGAQVDLQNNEKYTALMLAMEAEHKSVIDLLENHITNKNESSAISQQASSTDPSVDQSASSTDPLVTLPAQPASSTNLSDTPHNPLGSFKDFQETDSAATSFNIKHSYKWIKLAVLIMLVAVVTAYYYNTINSRTLHTKPKLGEMIYLEYSNGRNHLRIIEQITPYCETLAYMLGLRDDLVKNMGDITIPTTRTHKCRDTIRTWLEGQGHTPVTWETFIEALDKLQLRELSDLLQQIFFNIKETQ